MHTLALVLVDDEVHPKRVGRDVAGDDHADLLVFGPLTMVLSHVHTHDGPHSGRCKLADGTGVGTAIRVQAQECEQ